MMQHARQTLANRLLANEALSLSAQKFLSSELQSLVLDKDFERAAPTSDDESEPRGSGARAAQGERCQCVRPTAVASVALLLTRCMSYNFQSAACISGNR